jgi:hypothetical protein
MNRRTWKARKRSKLITIRPPITAGTTYEAFTFVLGGKDEDVNEIMVVLVVMFEVPPGGIAILVKVSKFGLSNVTRALDVKLSSNPVVVPFIDHLELMGNIFVSSILSARS